MDQQPKAVRVATFTIGDLTCHLTEKGAVSVYIKTQNGQEQYQFSLRPSTVPLMPGFEVITESEQWKQVIAAKELGKAQKYLDKRTAFAQEKAAKMVQAGLDNLRALGIDPATVLAKQGA